MAYFEVNKKPPLSFPSVSGAICTFNSQYSGLPLKEHEVDIDYTGSAISDCFVVNMADVTNISYFQGLLNGTYDFVDLGTLTWTYYSNVNAFYTNSLQNTIRKNSGTETATWILCAIYESSNIVAMVDGEDKAITVNTIGQVYVKDTAKGTDATAFKNSLDGVYLIYKLATPITPTITEAQFNALLSAFNISGEAFKIPFDTPIYGGSYDCLTGIVTSDKDSGGGDITPTYQQTATANINTLQGENNIWADTGDTSLQYIKLG